MLFLMPILKSLFLLIVHADAFVLAEILLSMLVQICKMLEVKISRMQLLKRRKRWWLQAKRASLK